MTNTANTFQEWTDDIEKARVACGAYGMSVAVVHKGKIVYAQGFGKRNDTSPFTPEVS
jgi:CubicO group peptidase (beta-lactamase class C family)